MSVAGSILSSEWVTLKRGEESIAEAWAMSEGGRDVFVFLVPRDRAESISVETLLCAAGVSTANAERWRLGDETDDRTGDWDRPLPAPSADDDQLTVYVTMTGPSDGDEAVTLEQWQDLESLWKAILTVEAGIDACRLGMDGLRGEMESALKHSLSVDEKLNALQNDVQQWGKAKSRIQFALPKIREFVHRATWALAVPERKRLEDVIKNHLEPRIPFPGIGRLRSQLEHLQKDRQVLMANGNAVGQDCRGILGDVRRTLSSLQRNAANRAAQKRSHSREKSKY